MFCALPFFPLCFALLVVVVFVVVVVACVICCVFVVLLFLLEAVCIGFLIWCFFFQYVAIFLYFCLFACLCVSDMVVCIAELSC